MKDLPCNTPPTFKCQPSSSNVELDFCHANILQHIAIIYILMLVRTRLQRPAKNLLWRGSSWSGDSVDSSSSSLLPKIVRESKRSEGSKKKNCQGSGCCSPWRCWWSCCYSARTSHFWNQWSADDSQELSRCDDLMGLLRECHVWHMWHVCDTCGWREWGFYNEKCCR